MTSTLEQTMSHQWGSYPADTIERYVGDIAATVGPYLDCIADGEINVEGRKRNDWVVGNMQRLEDVPGIDVLQPGDYSGYNDMSVLDIRDSLNPDNIDLGYYDVAMQSFPHLLAALRSRNLGHLQMQVGIPGNRQIPVLAFGQEKAMGQPEKYVAPFAVAGNRELFNLTHDQALREQGLTIQFEHPIETLAALAMAREGHAVDAALAGLIVEQVAQVPADTSTAVHFCYGRYMGGPLTAPDPEKPGSYRPVVELINETMHQWPAGHTPPRIVGMPLIAEGGHMPSDKDMREIVAQVKDLDLPEGTMLAPGTATIHTSTANLVEFNGAVQDAIGKPVAVSSPCGKASLRTQTGAAAKVLEREARTIRILREAGLVRSSSGGAL